MRSFTKMKGVPAPLLLLLLLTGGLAATTHRASGQVVINEVLADNQGAVQNGGDFPDYIELHNTGASSVSIAGWSLTDDIAVPRKYIFPGGTSIAARGYLVVWCDTRTGSPGLHTGFGLGAEGDRVRLYAANGSTVVDDVAFGLQLPNLSIGRIPNATGPWTLNEPTSRRVNTAEPLGESSQLRLNEWMARPPQGEDWLEVYNGVDLPVAVGGMIITDRASGTPTNRPIPALSFITGHGYWLFFASDLDRMDANHLDFKLGSGGETLTLYAPDATTMIDRVVFGSQSDGISQGRAPDGSANVIFFAAGRDTPGEANLILITEVVISEILSHTDPPLEDAIELQNLTAAPVDISHWWLSDSGNTPQKYRIPAGTVIPANGFIVFYQGAFDVGANAFSMNSAEGDDIYLSAGNAAGQLTGRQTSVAFSALKNGTSAGRVMTSVGADFAPLSRRTFGEDTPSSITQFRRGTGLPNAAPKIGPIIISEIHLQPAEDGGTASEDDEFIELRNTSAATVQLFDPLFPTNSWRISDGVTFRFPLNRTLPAQGILLIVSFDPEVETAKLEAFRTKFAVPAGVPIYGPFVGRLSDSGETIRLLWPDAPQGPDRPNAGLVPYEIIEKVDYLSTAPWPVAPTGSGHSLQRQVETGYGNDPAHWSRGTPTAGRPNQANPNADTDEDGLPDAWETLHGFDPQNAQDANGDADGDTGTNLFEYQTGTDPRNAASFFRIIQLQLKTEGQMELTFWSAAGKEYSLERGRNGGWEAVQPIPASEVAGPRTIPLTGDGITPTFYRIALPTSP